MAVVHVDSLTKTFVVPEREAGLRASIKALVKRRHREVHAVEAISFEIGQGEVVGFLGPNGAVTSRLGWSTVALALGFAAVLFAFTRWWWRFGLRHYSGASA